MVMIIPMVMLVVIWIDIWIEMIYKMVMIWIDMIYKESWTIEIKDRLNKSYDKQKQRRDGEWNKISTTHWELNEAMLLNNNWTTQWIKQQ